MTFSRLGHFWAVWNGVKVRVKMSEIFKPEVASKIARDRLAWNTNSKIGVNFYPEKHVDPGSRHIFEGIALKDCYDFSISLGKQILCKTTRNEFERPGNYIFVFIWAAVMVIMMGMIWSYKQEVKRKPIKRKPKPSAGSFNHGLELFCAYFSLRFLIQWLVKIREHNQGNFPYSARNSKLSQTRKCPYLMIPLDFFKP